MILRQFEGLGLARGPDETIIISIRRLLVKHELFADTLPVIDDYLGDYELSLCQGTIVVATLITTRSSTKNKEANATRSASDLEGKSKKLSARSIRQVQLRVKVNSPSE